MLPHNSQDPFQKQFDKAIECCVATGDAETFSNACEALTKQGADMPALLAGDADGVTPIFKAASFGHIAVLEVLCNLLIRDGKEFNPPLVDGPGLGSTPLYSAAQQGHLDVVKLLCTLLTKDGKDFNAPLVDGPGLGSTPLYSAACQGHQDVVTLLCTLLIKDGKEFNAPLVKGVETGVTPLYIAAQQGHLDVVKLLCTLLIEHGKEFNAPLVDGPILGGTPLYSAAHEGHQDVVKLLCTLLIKHGKEFNAPLVDGQALGSTPLDIAAHGGHLDVVKLLCTLLIEDGKEFNAPLVKGPILGATPLYSAACQGHQDVVKLLCTLLIKQGKEFNAPLVKGPILGVTPLYIAAYQGHRDVVKLLCTELIKQGKEFNAPLVKGGDRGITPLHSAAKEGHQDVVKLLCTLLIEDGKEFNAPLVDGQALGATPLNIAALYGHLRVVIILCERLIKLGQDINPPKACGKFKGTTPLQFAEKGGHTKVYQYLSAQIQAVARKKEVQRKTKTKQKSAKRTTPVAHQAAPSAALITQSPKPMVSPLQQKHDNLKALRSADTATKKVDSTVEYLQALMPMPEVNIRHENQSIIITISDKKYHTLLQKLCAQINGKLPPKQKVGVCRDLRGGNKQLTLNVRQRNAARVLAFFTSDKQHSELSQLFKEKEQATKQLDDSTTKEASQRKFTEGDEVCLQNLLRPIDFCDNRKKISNSSNENSLLFEYQYPTPEEELSPYSFSTFSVTNMEFEEIAQRLGRLGCEAVWDNKAHKMTVIIHPNDGVCFDKSEWRRVLYDRLGKLQNNMSEGKQVVEDDVLSDDVGNAEIQPESTDITPQNQHAIDHAQVSDFFAYLLNVDDGEMRDNWFELPGREHKINKFIRIKICKGMPVINLGERIFKPDELFKLLAEDEDHDIQLKEGGILSIPRTTLMGNLDALKKTIQENLSDPISAAVGYADSNHILTPSRSRIVSELPVLRTGFFVANDTSNQRRKKPMLPNTQLPTETIEAALSEAFLNVSSHASDIEHYEMSDGIDSEIFRQVMLYRLIRFFLAQFELLKREQKSHEALQAKLMRHMLCHLSMKAEQDSLYSMAIKLKMLHSHDTSHSDLFQELQRKWSTWTEDGFTAQQCLQQIKELYGLIVPINKVFSMNHLGPDAYNNKYPDRRDALHMIIASLGEVISVLQDNHKDVFRQLFTNTDRRAVAKKYRDYRNQAFHDCEGNIRIGDLLELLKQNPFQRLEAVLDQCRLKDDESDQSFTYHSTRQLK